MCPEITKLRSIRFDGRKMKAKVVSLRKNNFHIYTVCTVVLITTVLAFFVSVEIAAWTNLMKYAGTELTLYSSTLDDEMNLKETKVQTLYWNNSYGTLLNSSISERQKFDIQYDYVEIFNQLISLDSSIAGILLYYETRNNSAAAMQPIFLLI